MAQTYGKSTRGKAPLAVDLTKIAVMFVAPGTDPSVTSSSATRNGTHPIDVCEIAPDPENPRTAGGIAPVRDADLAAMVDSIRAVGIIQPITVRPAPEGHPAKFLVVVGENRLRAAILAGLERIDAFIRKDLSPEQVVALQWTENATRTDLSPLQRAYNLDQLRRLSPEARAKGQELTWPELLNTPYARNEPAMAVKTLYPRLLRLPEATKTLIAYRSDITWSRLYQAAFRGVRDEVAVHAHIEDMLREADAVALSGDEEADAPRGAPAAGAVDAFVGGVSDAEGPYSDDSAADRARTTATERAQHGAPAASVLRRSITALTAHETRARGPARSLVIKTEVPSGRATTAAATAANVEERIRTMEWAAAEIATALAELREVAATS